MTDNETTKTLERNVGRGSRTRKRRKNSRTSRTTKAEIKEEVKEPETAAENEPEKETVEAPEAEKAKAVEEAPEVEKEVVEEESEVEEVEESEAEKTVNPKKNPKQIGVISMTLLEGRELDVITRENVDEDFKQEVMDAGAESLARMFPVRYLYRSLSIRKKNPIQNQTNCPKICNGPQRRSNI